MVLQQLQGKTLRLDADLLKKMGIYAFVFSELVAFIGGGYLLGSWLDKRLGFTPALTVVLATLGLSYSVWRIHRLSTQWLKK